MGLVGKPQYRPDPGNWWWESFASNDEIESMMDQWLDRFDCSTASIFSTNNQKQHTGDYLYESAEKISFCFEEKAFGDDVNSKQPKQLSINKVGHGIVGHCLRFYV